MADLGFPELLTLVQTIAIIAAIIIAVYFSRRQIQALETDLEARVVNDLDEKLHRIGEIFMEKPEIDPILFHATLIVIGVAIFYLVYAGLYFYTLTLPYSLNPAESAAIQRRGDLFWLVGYLVLLLEPTLILLTVGLLIVALVWLALWLSYIYLTLHEYRKALKQKVR